jgi:hypothetical protein
MLHGKTSRLPVRLLGVLLDVHHSCDSLRGVPMALLWLANVSAETTDEELKAFLERYGFPAADSIVRVAGDGTHPLAMISYELLDNASLREFALRIQGVLWNGAQLHANVADATHM